MSWHTQSARPGRPAAPVMEPSATDGSVDAIGAADQAVTSERAERFLAMSVILTGYGRVQLLGTGLTTAYLRAIDTALPSGVLDDLVSAFGRVLAGSRSSEADLAANVASVILDDPRLGPVARNVILLWYCGTWHALSDAWHAAYGAPPHDATGVVSAQAYQGGLQWAAAGAHPAGARQQGFGAWSAPPEPVPPASAPPEPVPEGAGT